MEYWIGLLCAASAAIAFGVQYAPVKKYEIYDGITFQWELCTGAVNMRVINQRRLALGFAQSQANQH
eukprot:s870_g23.t1